MAQGDITSYALALEFTLNDALAQDSLDSIGTKFDSIETQLQTIAQQSTLSFSASLDTTLGLVTQISNEYEQISTAIKAMTAPLSNSNALAENQVGLVTDEGKIVKDDMAKNWQTILDILNKKESLLGTELQLLEDESEETDKIHRNIAQWPKSIEQSLRGLQQVMRSLTDINNAINVNITDADRFVEANYRIYGSQTQLVQQSNRLATQYGVLRGNVIEAVQTFANLRTPIDNINQLVGSTTRFSRATGQATSLTATWQHALMSTGLSAQQAIRTTEFLAVAMRQFGLNARDVNHVLSTQVDQLTQLQLTFGNDTTQAIQQAQIAMGAVARQIGLTDTQVQNVISSLGTMEFWQLRRFAEDVGMLREQMDSASGYTEAYARHIWRLAQEYRNASSDIDRERIRQTAIAIYGNQLGTSMATLGLQVSEQSERFRELNDVMQLVNNVNSASASSMQSLASIYSESNATIQRQLELLQNSFIAAFGTFVNVITPSVVTFLQWVNTFVGGIANAITQVDRWLDSLGLTGDVLRWVIGAFLALVVILGLVISVMNVFGATSRFVSNIGTAVGNAVGNALTGIARGLQAISPYTVTLLALSAVMISVGVAAYLLVLSTARLVELGQEGAMALAGLTVAIIALAIGLATAAYIAAAAAPALFALSAVILAGAIAAYIFAEAVRVLASVGDGAAAALYTLGTALVVISLGLSLVALIATAAVPGLLALSVALVAVGAAAFMFGYGVALIASALQILTPELANNLYLFAVSVIDLSPLLYDAGIALMANGAILLVGSYIIGVAGAVLIVASTLLFLAGLMVYTGALMLVASGPLLSQAANSLAAGAELISWAPVVLLGAALMLIPAAVVLLAVGVMLMAGAGALALAGIYVFIGGYGIQYGAQALNIGAPLLASGALKLLQAIPFLMMASFGALAGSVALVAVGIILAVAGVALLVAGTLVFTGAFLLFSGASLLALAAIMFLPSSIALMAGAMLLFPTAIALIAASIILSVAATIFLVPATLLAVGGLLLLVGGVSLLLGAMSLWTGASFLHPAANMINNAGFSLFIAGGVLFSAGLVLTLGSASLLVSSVIFFVGSTFLLAGALIFTVAVFFLAASIYFFSSLMEVFAESVLPFGLVATGLFVSALLFSFGAILLLAGAVALSVAAPLLVIAGAAIYAATYALQPGVRALENSAVALYEYGPMIGHGARQLLAGARDLQAAAPLLDSSGDALYDASYALQDGIRALRNSSNDISRIGPSIATGASQLLTAGHNIHLASSLMTSSSGNIQSFSNSLPGFASNVVTMSYAVGMLNVVVDSLLSSLSSPIAGRIEALSSNLQSSSLVLLNTVDLIIGTIDSYDRRLTLSTNRLVNSLASVRPAFEFSLYNEQAISQPVFFNEEATTITTDYYRYESLRLLNDIANKLQSVRNSGENIDRTSTEILENNSRNLIRTILNLLSEHLPEIAENSADNSGGGLSGW